MSSYTLRIGYIIQCFWNLVAYTVESGYGKELVTWPQDGKEYNILRNKQNHQQFLK